MTTTVFEERCHQCRTDIKIPSDDLELVAPPSIGEPIPATHYRYRCTECSAGVSVVIGSTTRRLIEATGVVATVEPTINVEHVIIRAEMPTTGKEDTP